MTPGLESQPADEVGALPPWLALIDAHLADRGEALVIKQLPSGRNVHVQGRVEALLGIAPAALLGRTDAEVFGASAALVLRAADQAAWDRQGPLASEHSLELGGRTRTLRVLRVPVAGPSQGWLGCFWSDPEPLHQLQQQGSQAQAQIEQLQRVNTQLRRELAEVLPRDASSGLPTRAHFDEQLKREIDLSQREQRDFALVMLQLDAPAGPAARDADVRDAVLESVGRVLKAGTRVMDACCRLDADRFAVLLSGVGLATAHARTEALRRQCATQIVVVRGVEHRLTVSAGVASFPHTAAAAEGLMSACEAALQEALLRGGNHVALARVPFAPSA